MKVMPITSRAVFDPSRPVDPVKPVAPVKEDRSAEATDGDPSPDLRSALREMRRAKELFATKLEFEVTAGEHVVIRVIDVASGNIVREIPPEDLKRALKHLEEALGLLVDKKV
jgi:uncharacterized FlaG/YvyC family protein